MGCFGPRLTEEEKYEILRRQDEYIENYGLPQSKYMLSYFLLVFSALVWMVFTFIMWHQGKTVDATASTIIMHTYI